MSIADHNRTTTAYAPEVSRHPVCAAVDHVLDLIIKDQDTGKSNVAEAMGVEFGISFAAAMCRAAQTRRDRHTMKTHGSTSQLPEGADPSGISKGDYI